MSAPTILGVVGSVLILVVLFELLRRRHLREKYALIWAGVAIGVLTLTIFPGLLTFALGRWPVSTCPPTCCSSWPAWC